MNSEEQKTENEPPTADEILAKLKENNTITFRSQLANLVYLIFLLSLSYKLLRYWGGAWYEKHLCAFDPICSFSHHVKDWNPKITVLSSYMEEINQLKYQKFMIDTITFDTFLVFAGIAGLYFLYRKGWAVSKWALIEFENSLKISDGLNSAQKRGADPQKFYNLMDAFFIFWSLMIGFMFFYETRGDAYFRNRSLLSQIYENPLVSIKDTFVITIYLAMLTIIPKYTALFHAIRQAEEEKQKQRPDNKPDTLSRV